LADEGPRDEQTQDDQVEEAPQGQDQQKEDQERRQNQDQDQHEGEGEEGDEGEEVRTQEHALAGGRRDERCCVARPPARLLRPRPLTGRRPRHSAVASTSSFGVSFCAMRFSKARYWSSEKRFWMFSMAHRHTDSGALALHALTKASTISAGYGAARPLEQPRSVHPAIAIIVHPRLVQRRRIGAQV